MIPKMPEFKANRNGYEIRTDVLKMAQDLLNQEFHYKYMGWEASVEKDKEGKIVTKVGMPQFPGIEQVLQTAEKMYNFVNGKK